jgi:hypothetical protein
MELLPKDLDTLRQLGLVRILGHEPSGACVYELTPIGRVIVERLLSEQGESEEPRPTGECSSSSESA